MVVAIVLFVLLAVSVLFNAGSLLQGFTNLHGGGARYAGPRLDEVVIKDNDSHLKIAVIPVEGIITRYDGGSGGNMVDVIKAQFRRAEEDRRVKAVLLRVDSPGGEVLASDEIAVAVSDFQSRSGKPVIVSMGGLAASGGYYVSAPARWIVANELTITGSIGVIMQGFNYRGLMDKVGLAPVVYKSGKFKDMLSGSRPPGDVTQEERDMVNALIDETYRKFKSVVADGRKNALEQNKSGKMDGRALVQDWTDYADGRVFSGKQARDLGFVDELGDFDKAVERAETIAGISGANLIEYRQRHDLADFLGMFGESGASTRTIKLDIGIETPKIEAGRLYFLSPTFLH